MLDPKKSRYLYLMLAGFGAIAMSLILFFFLFRLRGIGDAIRTLGDIMAPFIYGGVMAYLLCPLCNCYESFFRDLIPRRYHNAVGPIAVALSLITGLLLVYALIIMIAPQLYHSVLSLWNSLPDKVNQFTQWATATFGEDEALLQYFDTS